MRLLESIKKQIESIEAKKNPIVENEEFVELFEKYKDIPAETLKAIIADVKAVCMPAESEETEEPNKEEVVETEQETNVVDAAEVKPDDVEHTDANKAESAQMTELDASEDNDEEIDDDLIISEEDEDDELIISEEDDEQAEEKDDVLFDEYQDELDIAEADCQDDEMIEENAEKIDMTIPGSDDSVKSADKAANETAEQIDMTIPSKDNSDDAADAAAKEQKNEANTGAKAAVANRDNKGAFSADVDALTDYLDEY